MNLDRISFRTDEKERQFLAAINQRYGKKTATALMHAVLADYMRRVGVDPQNNPQYAKENSVKTMPDSAAGQDRKGESESPASSGVAPFSQPNYYHRRIDRSEDELPATRTVRQLADWMEQMARFKKARDQVLGLG